MGFCMENLNQFGGRCKQLLKLQNVYNQFALSFISLIAICCASAQSYIYKVDKVVKVYLQIDCFQVITIKKTVAKRFRFLPFFFVFFQECGMKHLKVCK